MSEDIITISQNTKYSLYGIIKSEESTARTLLILKIDNNKINIGELINSDTYHEWVEVNEQAIAIVGKDSSSKNQYLKTLFYIPDKSFVSNDSNNLITKFKELFGIKDNNQKVKIYKRS